MTDETRQPTPTVQKFLDQLRSVMEEQRISQAELARRIERPESYVSKLLRGESNLTAPTMERLATAIGARIEVQLVGGADEAPDESASQTPENGQDRSRLVPSPALQRLDARTRALALADELPADVLKALSELSSESETSVGRPPGPLYDYAPHMRHMALLLETKEERSERKAAERTVQWAKEQPRERGVAIVSASTLRRHFAENRDAHLESARAELAEKRKAEAAEQAPAPKRPTRVYRRSGGGGGAARPLSSYGSVTRELRRLQDELRFPAEVMESLKTPYVLEEVGRLAAAAPVAAIEREATLPLDANHRAAIQSIPREVNMAARHIEDAVTKVEPGLASMNLIPETATAGIARDLAATDLRERIARAADFQVGRDVHERLASVSDFLSANDYFRDIF